jgi:hypothetical protein
VRVGTRVEVRNRFDSRWSKGFEVAAIEKEIDGVRVQLRRRSDGALLPAWFTPDELREERRRETWWV